ncbi:MAG: glycine dehydrogenase (decarboxylating) subunit 1 [Eubacteriales bacterium SKADARSKE-1]|nr:glycine dehydrogenase (decarboxylating) subunit 1 [Eubacteriales bacterium SKADARSKE-1]
MGSYVPSTIDERNDMLKAVGLDNIDQLFSSIPDEVKVKKLNLPLGQSELEVRRSMENIADKNVVFKKIFRGAGAYNHYIPAIVKSVTSKEDFLTAYTPYQAEISQGLLQAIFEYQTMICELTGMDVSNASVYDGATAAAESVAMVTDKKRNKIIVSSTIHMHVLKTIKTYCEGSGVEVIVAPEKDGVTDTEALKTLLDETVAGVYMQQPNFYGIIEDAENLSELTHAAGAKFIMGCNPISLAILKTPFECGADIAVGEGQPLGMPLSFGGPYLGFMACREALMRKLPGRIVGETVDLEGKKAFVLTLQAREQHIRREKASSNICSNQALCALTASVYLSAMGHDGLIDVANQCISKTRYLANELCKIEGIRLKYADKEFFNEFVTTCSIKPNELLQKLEQKGILGGYPIDDGILWCATEMNSKDQIDELVASVKEAVKR